VSQPQRPAWTGGSDEALVPLGRGEEPVPAVGAEGRAAEQTRPPEPRAPERRAPAGSPPRPESPESPEQGRAPGQPPPPHPRDLVDGRPERVDRAGRLAGMTTPASGRSTATAADFTPQR
jgi:hypothetical protein